MTAAPPPQNILVIKLSALGDVVLSIGAFQAIRAHHARARIALLTTKPFARLAEASGCAGMVGGRAGAGQSHHGRGDRHGSGRIRPGWSD